MQNLNFAVICSYNCVKLFNESEELTEEQRDLLFELECSAWNKVTDMQEFNFKGDCDYSPLYQAIKAKVLEVLQNNKLTFSDSRCYGYLIDSVYEIIRTK